MIIKTEKTTHEDCDGNITIDTKETSFTKNPEPDYVKLYTKTWCEFNDIPVTYRPLFLELIQRMSYCNSQEINHSQLVYTGKPFADVIMESLGWKKNMYQKGLKQLVEAGAIRRVAKGVYQINPSYAGKGGWKYDPRKKQGGIKDLIATFNFKDKTVDTKIVWANDDEDTMLNELYRNTLDVSRNSDAVLYETTIKNNENENNNKKNNDRKEEIA